MITKKRVLLWCLLLTGWWTLTALAGPVFQEDSPGCDPQWHYIGPQQMSGRIVDIESYPESPEILLVGAASAGVYRSLDAGRRWQYIFRSEGYNAIGDIDVYPSNRNIIWVGTGEPNASRSSFYGEGVFCTLDGGGTWLHKGLEDTHYISKILIHPDDPATVYAAAVGPLHTEGPSRGLFKTTDNGDSWEKILSLTDRTGIIDLVMHPGNPDILYAAAWERLKRPWKFEPYGPASGIYKSTDGGESWERIFSGNGFTGRIGLAIGVSDPQVVYALVDNHREQDPVSGGEEILTIDTLSDLSIEEFLNLKNRELQQLLDRMLAQKVYTPAVLKAFVRQNRISPREVALMLFDINKRRFNPFITGPELYRSADGGKRWEKMNRDSLNPFFYTFGFFFGKVFVSPSDSDTVYVLGIEMLKSRDGGRTFEVMTRQTDTRDQRMIHVDAHALWINPANPEQIYLGTDGGINLSDDGGDSWEPVLNIPVTQCYRISLGKGNSPPVYSGLQDNGVVMGYRQGPDPFRYYWLKILNRDGGNTCEVPGFGGELFSAYQFGEIFRINLKNGQRTGIKPEASPLTTPYRFHWLTPFFVSPHDPEKLYLGANMVLLSEDRGNQWTPVSPDLSRGREVDNPLPYGTVTALCESPVTAGLLFAGTDDGNLWVSKPGTQNWRRIGQVLPDREVSSLCPSRFSAGKIYVTLSGFFNDDRTSYIYMSPNLGADWMSISGNLQDEPVFVLTEYPAAPGILIGGTARDLYLSRDDGASWQSIRGDIPAVPFYDLAIDDTGSHVLVGTHGRGIYRLENARDFILRADGK